MTAAISRRVALGRIVAAAIALPGAAVAASAVGPDAELVALGAEIARRCAELELWKAALGDGRESGLHEAIQKLHAFDQETDRLFARLMATPSRTRPGRAAKVKALFAHCLLSDWRGPAEELDWEIETTRAMLGEFAGMSADELAAI